MTIPIKLGEVVDALESQTEELSYYLDKRTGEINLITNDDMRAAEEDELISEYPDWQRDSILKAREILASEEQFLPLPDQFEIDEYRMMERFCQDFSDQQVGERLLRLIKGSGAFGRFKNAIHSMGIQNDWYSFKRARLEEMALEWLEEHEISFSRDDMPDELGVTM
jgi:Uncharacterised protein family (UPF0158)